MTIAELLERYGKDLPWGLQGMLKAIITNKLPKKEKPDEKSILDYPIMVNGKLMTDLRIVVLKVNNGDTGYVCIATDEGSITALEHSANMLEQDGTASEQLSRIEDRKA